jgi:uncharacterized protein YbaR (Trm112 family)
VEGFLLKRLVCPESRQPLTILDGATLARLNEDIRSGKIKTKSGKIVSEPIEKALVRADRRAIYPLVNQIALLTPESIIFLEATHRN